MRSKTVAGTITYTTRNGETRTLTASDLRPRFWKSDLMQLIPYGSMLRAINFSLDGLAVHIPNGRETS